MVDKAGAGALPGVAVAITPRVSDLNAGELIAAGIYRTEFIAAGLCPANREISCSKNAGTLS